MNGDLVVQLIVVDPDSLVVLDNVVGTDIVVVAMDHQVADLIVVVAAVVVDSRLVHLDSLDFQRLIVVRALDTAQDFVPLADMVTGLLMDLSGKSE